MEYLLIMAAGFAGSFHCIGMCGGLACALGGDPRGRGATAVRHLLYNTGRVSTYVFLGTLVGSVAVAFCGPGATAALMLTGTSAEPLLLGQRVLAVAAGALMLVMAAQLFGLFRSLHQATLRVGTSRFFASVRGLMAAPGPGAPLTLGVLNGFLPCPLVYAFLAKAAASGSVGAASLTMLSFGLGTFPAMLFTGGVGRLLAPVWRHRGVRIAGAFLLILGLITLARGLLPPGSHSH